MRDGKDIKKLGLNGEKVCHDSVPPSRVNIFGLGQALGCGVMT
jgi:hypothetical protein